VGKTRFVVETHLRTGRPVAELAAQYEVDRSWVYRRLARYRREGEAGLDPKSRRPKHSPTRIADLYEDEIVALRKELHDFGADAGAETIHYHLSQRRSDVPSVSTIWRVLKARGFVTPQPHKRPKSSYIRFVADLPNECWQADVTHVEVADGVVFEVLNMIDDHSRVCVGSRAFVSTRSADVVRSLHRAAGHWGYPERFLSDNGADGIPIVDPPAMRAVAVGG
jgi:transposase InsO family protein